MKTKTGGQAFPVPISRDESGWSGMTLRDWFAGQAIIGVLELERPDYFDSADWNGCAAYAYRLADAMLAARERDIPK